MLMQKVEGSALRGHLEGIVLSILSEGEYHGFEIMRKVEVRTGRAVLLKEGTLYPVLYRLENQGHLKARWESDAESRTHQGPKRRLYQITSKGRKKLERSKSEWQQIVHVIGGFLKPAI